MIIIHPVSVGRSEWRLGVSANSSQVGRWLYRAVSVRFGSLLSSPKFRAFRHLGEVATGWWGFSPASRRQPLSPLPSLGEGPEEAPRYGREGPCRRFILFLQEPLVFSLE